MKEVYKIRLYEMDPKYRIEIFQYVTIPLIAIIVFLFFANSIEVYQVIILFLIAAFISFIDIKSFFSRRFLHVVINDDKKMQILVKRKNSVLFEIQNVEIEKIGWNYRISESLSAVKIYSITHRTNHNLVLKLKSDDGSRKLNLIQKLKPWQELPANYPYLNDLDSNEINYQIRQIEKLNQILVKK